MTEETRDNHEHVHQAFDELLKLYRQLELENELLRGQLRRHPVGEMQIRETERKMIELRGSVSLPTQDRLLALITSRDAAEAEHLT